MSKTFSFAPLTEVAFEIIFSPKLKILDNIADFQEQISDSYPIIAQELSPFKEDKINKTIIFENKTQTKLLRLKIGSFNLIEKSYISFDLFLSEICELLKIFNSVYGQPNVQRIGLRYINQLLIPKEKEDLDISDISKTYFDINAFNGKKINSISIDARVSINDVSMTIRSGFLKNPDETKSEKIILLDYDCYKTGDNILQDNLKEILEEYHNNIESQFLEDVQEPYLRYMETGSWG